MQNEKVSPPSYPGNIVGWYTALDADLVLQFDCDGKSSTAGTVAAYRSGNSTLVWSGDYSIKGDTITASVRNPVNGKTEALMFKTLGNDGLRKESSSSAGKLFWHSQMELDEG